MCCKIFCTLSQLNLPKLEVGVHHPVGESLTTDTDTLKYTVTSELVHYQMGVDETCERNNSASYIFVMKSVLSLSKHVYQIIFTAFTLQFILENFHMEGDIFSRNVLIVVAHLEGRSCSRCMHADQIFPGQTLVNINKFHNLQRGKC